MQDKYSVLMHGVPAGQQGEWRALAVSTSGVLIAELGTSAGDSILNTPADGQSPTAGRNVPVIGFNALFNGATFDRQRGNSEITALASAARTLATTSADFTNYNARGLHLIINVSAYTSGTLTVTIQGKDPISNNYYSILVGTGITATGTTILKVYPGIQAIVNASASDILPRIWRVSCSAVSATYSIAGVLVV